MITEFSITAIQSISYNRRKYGLYFTFCTLCFRRKVCTSTANKMMITIAPITATIIVVKSNPVPPLILSDSGSVPGNEYVNYLPSRAHMCRERRGIVTDREREFIPSTFSTMSSLCIVRTEL